MIVTTDAIVLKTMKYGDTSRIVTLFTQDFGKISIIAKGARGKKAKFGAALDIMSHSTIVLYKKENRDLHLLSQADLIRQFKSVIDDSSKLMIGFAILEFLNAAVHGEEHHEQLFSMLLLSLKGLNDISRHSENILIRYLERLAEAFGVGLDTEHCIAGREAFDDEQVITGSVHFSPFEGGFRCTDCGAAAGCMTVRGETLQVIRWLRHETHDPSVLAVSTRARREALNLLHRHLASHIPDMRTIHSFQLLEIFSDT